MPFDKSWDKEYLDVLMKMNKGEKLTIDEIHKLPEYYQTLYYSKDYANEKKEENIQRREKVRIAKEKRRARLEYEQTVYERALTKLSGNSPLLSYEEEIYEKHASKVSEIKEPEVQVYAVDILNDVVQGSYTLQDIEMIRKSSSLKPPKDDFQASPIRLLDTVVENVKQQRQDVLQTSYSNHFFKATEGDPDNRIPPINLNDVISACATGIDLMRGSKFEENDAQDAAESYIKAIAMYEGEIKIRSAIHNVNKKQIEDELKKLAEVAAVSSALNENSSKGTAESFKKMDETKIGFNITHSNFDFSFNPSDDVNAYKPLEIVSYIGMTK